MKFFETIRQKTTQRKLRFMVIGGLAVNHYGLSRDTSDVDFFISQNDRTGWSKMLADLGYTYCHDGGCFIQYTPPTNSAWPVDLMLVPEKTFASMYDASCDADFFNVKMKVPSLEHLLALKVHSLKNTRMHRFLKDFLDVENLIRINQIDIRSKAIRELFDKYGTKDLYEKISRSLAEG